MVSLQPCHLGNPAECAKLVELAVSEFGRIDVLYNLAAKAHLHWFEGFTDEEWNAARKDEVDLVFYLTRASFVCSRMLSYWANSSCGKPIIVSTIPMPDGMPMLNPLPPCAPRALQPCCSQESSSRGRRRSQAEVRVREMPPAVRDHDLDSAWEARPATAPRDPAGR